MDDVPSALMTIDAAQIEAARIAARVACRRDRCVAHVVM
jgi:hypothetical protein